MGFMDALRKIREKKKAEKQEFKAMEREERFKHKLEQKKKTPMQKEFEFYQREKFRENLKKAVELERKQRKAKMRSLSDPFNNKSLFKERLEIKDGNFMKNNNSIMGGHNAFK